MRVIEMLDILLTPDGDLNITESGDIQLTESVRQAIRVRLLWFFSEWRFAPEFGVPWFEDILVKNPTANRIRRIIRSEIMSVEKVRDIRDLQIDINAQSRRAVFSFIVVTDEETYREEMVAPWPSTV